MTQKPVRLTGMSTFTQQTESGSLALPAAEVAKLLNISLRHLHGLNARGALPRPIRLGRSVRWSAPEIRAWIAAGAPSRDVWEALQRGGGANG